METLTKPSGKSRYMEVVERQYGQPIQAVITSLLAEKPLPKWGEMAGRLGISPGTFRSWVRQVGLAGELERVTWQARQLAREARRAAKETRARTAWEARQRASEARRAAKESRRRERARRPRDPKTPRMRALEAQHEQPIESIIARLMAEQPRLTWLQMAARLGVGERTFRSWARALGARREIIWSLPGDTQE
jgi:hypothetical protein